MRWILRVLILISANLLAKGSRTIYEAKENDNVTIGWRCSIKTDMTLIEMICFFHLDIDRIFYEMIEGVEVVDSQYQQFARRVQCDRDALGEGRIRLHLSRVTTKDSGNYSCHVAANYDKISKSWVLEMSEYFLLNVTRSPDGKNSDMSGNTPGSATTSGAEHSPEGPKHEDEWSNPTRAGVVLAALAGASILFCVVFRSARALKSKICPQQHEVHTLDRNCTIST
ncbi:uncharacterized protein PAE49_021513 [Odontesthes bonariensis]|uniref:uncharacterized protein LOC142368887 n=1 Tax=Odontesthes bonariensis TaxID=219752 RepID=UPI003F58DD93